MTGKEFDAEGFAAFHPGGSLGKKLSAENVGVSEQWDVCQYELSLSDD